MRLLSIRKVKVTGPTWFLPIDASDEDNEAVQEVSEDENVYVPVDQGAHWCIDGVPFYGYAIEIEDTGYYVHHRTTAPPEPSTAFESVIEDEEE